MREWGYLPSAEELEIVVIALKIYRDGWGALRNPPFHAAFDGSPDDVRALDYLDYEGIEIVGAGIEPASKVCGEVLRRAAGLEWFISYRGDWFVASDEPYREIAICPLARLHEIECSSDRGWGKYERCVQKAAFDCLLLLEGEERRRVCELLDDTQSPYLESVLRTVEELHRPLPADRHRKRRRS